MPEPDWLEFDALINLRPSFGNRSRGVDDPAVRERNADLARGALHRALELFDLTLADPRHVAAPPRLREIASAREVVAAP